MGMPISGQGYFDGASLYQAYFAPDFVDPTGMNIEVMPCTIYLWVGHQGNSPFNNGGGAVLKKLEDNLKRAKAKPPTNGCPPVDSFRVGFLPCHGSELNNELNNYDLNNALPGMPPMTGFGVDVPPGKTLNDADPPNSPLHEKGDFNMADAVAAALKTAELYGPKLCSPCCHQVTIVVHCADYNQDHAQPTDVTPYCGQQLTVPCDWITSPAPGHQDEQVLTEWGHAPWTNSPSDKQ